MESAVCTEVNRGNMNKDVWKYFSTTNKINKNIIDQERTFVKHLDNKWSDIPNDRKNALLDLLFVSDDIRTTYSDSSEFGKSKAVDDELQEPFPRLYRDSGQKINVDFESDLWTWRDEHSGPFSWMSRSQQDLTLADLEPETISKPQPKVARGDSDQLPVKALEPQFTYPSNCWYQDILQDFKKNEEKVVLTPSPSVNLTSVQVELEDKKSSAKNQNEKTATPPPVQDPEIKEEPETISYEEEKVETTSDRKPKSKERGRRSRSPSPKKMIRSGSFKRSPVKIKEEQLITKDESENTGDGNAFSNPLMEGDWSTFVGEEPQQKGPVTTAPAILTMDRGGNDSPYRGDQVQLIDRATAAYSSSVKLSSPSVSGWSEESTPDHTTHLLKGLQSPVHHRSNRGYVNSETDLDRPAEPLEKGSLENYGKPAEEVLRVEKDGGSITFTTDVETNEDSDVVKTGFDFLDNW